MSRCLKKCHEWARIAAMLVIREAQLRRFDEEVRARFIDEVEEAARKNLAAQVAPLQPQDLRARIAFAVSRAEEIGLSWRSSILLFAQLMLVIGPDFDQRPALGEYLDADPAERDARMLRITTAGPSSCLEPSDAAEAESRWQAVLGSAR